MTTHVHTWHPAEGVTARYRCDCGAWGRRPRRGGEIVERVTAPYNARKSATVGEQRGVAFGGRAPSLDETERRR